MNFGLAIISTAEIKGKSSVIQVLSDDLKTFFRNKKYGDEIKTLTIGIVCVSPQFEKFFKQKKPRYTKGKKIVHPDGIPFTLEDDFEYDIKIDFNEVVDADEMKMRKILAREILDSLSVLDGFKSKIKYFDIDRFKMDLKDYFISQDLL